MKKLLFLLVAVIGFAINASAGVGNQCAIKGSNGKSVTVDIVKDDGCTLLSDYNGELGTATVVVTFTLSDGTTCIQNVSVKAEGTIDVICTCRGKQKVTDVTFSGARCEK